MHPPSPHSFAFLAAMACASCTASLAAQELRRDVSTAIPVAPQQAAEPAAAAIERAGIIVVGGRTGESDTVSLPATGTGALNPQPLPPRPPHTVQPTTRVAQPDSTGRAGIIVVGGKSGTTGADAAARTPAPTPP